MKKHITPAWLLMSGILAGIQPAAAYELGRVNIKLSGEVIAYTCGVEVSQANKKVELGRWPLKNLKNTGDTTKAIPFSFALHNCPPSSLVTVVFSGKKDAKDRELLAINDGISAAKAVAVEILDAQENRLPLDAKSPAVKMDINGNGTAQFYARYSATGNQTAPGIADADATFRISYD